MDNLAASLNTKIDMIHLAVQHLGQLNNIKIQGQEAALHSAQDFEDPVILKADTLAKQDVTRAVKLLLYSLEILIREYL
jgi:hypothetical protein